jgi:hypothetical protein
MKLHPNDQETLDGVARAQCGDTGRHEYSMCAVCGELDWRSTSKNAPFEVALSINDPRQCSRCTEAYQRNPEFYNWILNVLGNMERRKRAEEYAASTAVKG